MYGSAERERELRAVVLHTGATEEISAATIDLPFACRVSVLRSRPISGLVGLGRRSAGSLGTSEGCLRWPSRQISSPLKAVERRSQWWRQRHVAMTATTLSGTTVQQIRSAGVLCFWIFCNACVVISNKHLFQSGNFQYPFVLTCVHMMFSFAGSWLMMRLFRIERTSLSWSQLFTVVFPLSVVYAVNIVLGNLSLQWIPVSFMQTVKSSVPAFTAVFAIVILRRRLYWMANLALVPVVGGVALATKTEVNFHLVGFVACLVASAFTAIYSILSEKVLIGTNKLDSTNLVFYMCPMVFMILLPGAVLYDLHGLIQDWLPQATPLSLFLVAGSGSMAFLLNFSTFLAIACTSALTYNVAGNLKAVINICSSVLVFRNEISPLNGVGCAITMLGVILYNYAVNRGKALAALQAQLQSASQHLSSHKRLEVCVDVHGVAAASKNSE